MKKTYFYTVSLLVVLAVFPVLLSSSKSAKGMDPAQASLEKMLAQALRLNPDILLVEAKVRSAHAELNQARLKVTQDVVSLYYQRKSQDSAKGEYSNLVKRARMRVESGTDTGENLGKVLLAQAEVEANLAATEAALVYLLGVANEAESRPRSASDARIANEDESTAHGRPPTPERFHQALATPIDVAYEDATLKEAFQNLQELTGVTFLLAADMREAAEEVTVALRLEKTAVRDVLLALVDVSEIEFCFVFRSYGVLVVDRDAARGLEGGAIPADVPLVRE